MDATLAEPVTSLVYLASGDSPGDQPAWNARTRRALSHPTRYEFTPPGLWRVPLRAVANAYSPGRPRLPA